MFESQPIAQLIESVTTRLEAASESPRLDAEILLGLAIDMPRAYLYAHPEDVPDADALKRLELTLVRRLAGEPMAYITGTREFWSMELAVSPATLVPRPETEILVERVLREIPRNAGWGILDLGTGSGAIALAIATERPLCRLVAVDRSRQALDVAELNARRLNVATIAFVEGDWTAPVADDCFDLIVSNPPYVRRDDDALERLGGEPEAALVAGPDGLDAIRILARDCPAILRPGGLFAFEHGSDQDRAVAGILRARGWSDIACHRDYSGHPRVTTARLPAPQGVL